MYKSCQSCDMPLKSKPENCGTEQDGSRSDRYCHYCYQDGKFVNPDIKTASEMKAFVKEKLKEKGFPGFVAGFLTLRIPKLERWR